MGAGVCRVNGGVGGLCMCVCVHTCSGCRDQGVSWISGFCVRVSWTPGWGGDCVCKCAPDTWVI